MRELTLKELQAKSLEITKDIHDFCVANGIRYNIAFGSLLGAVRHGGFIPWDDDMDIVMPRPDYDRFVATYKSDRFRMVCLENTPDCYIPFGRVCDTEETLARSIIPWHGHSFKSGVWVDIFPLDAIPQDPEEYRLHYGVLNHLYSYTVKLRKVQAILGDAFSFKTQFKVLQRRRTHPRLVKENPVDYVKYIHNIIAKYPFTEDCRVSQLCCPDTEDGGIMYQDTSEYMEMPFDGVNLMVPVNYDKVLKLSFGEDYMTPPPAKKRKPLQSNYVRFYWKK